jgi:hypothetical protein
MRIIVPHALSSSLSLLVACSRCLVVKYELMS